MGWARIDDGFDDHPKILALLDHDEGGAAVGLWTLCLTWAHRNTRKAGKVPGLIPASLPRRYLGPGARDLAKLLVAEGLWDERAEDDGWRIHDFDRYLPTAETREARAEAGRRGAEARWGKHAGRDSNLPSDDGKPIASDGSVMASDGSGSMFGAEQPPAGTSDQSHSLTDGNKPSPDSNLPSGLPSGSGKPIASDGSRAPARRAIPNGIAPVPAPIPVPPSAGADEPRRRLPPDQVAERQRHVGEVVAAFADGATGAGLHNPPASLRSRVGKQAKALLAEDWPIDFLIESARRMGAGEFDDLARQARKDDAAAKGRSTQNGAGPNAGKSTGADRAQEALDAGQRVQRLIDEGKLTT